MDTQKIKNALRGFVLGDIAGLPYEFKKPEQLKDHPFIFMDSAMKERSHMQPLDSWSDDTGMMLAALVGINQQFSTEPTEEIPFKNVPVAMNFLSWYVSGQFMPYGDVFDVGSNTSTSLRSLFLHSKQNHFYEHATGEGALRLFIHQPSRWKRMYGDTNGALMRILPHVLYTLHVPHNEDFLLSFLQDSVYITHPSMKCFLTCVFYREVIRGLLEAKDVQASIEEGQRAFRLIFEQKEERYQKEWMEQVRMRGVGRWIPNLKSEIAPLLYDDLHSPHLTTSYNSTFESLGALVVAIWAISNAHSFEDVIARVISVGGDTDTVAAIAGSMSGIVDRAPMEWYEKIPSRNRDYLDSAFQNFIDVIEFISK